MRKKKDNRMKCYFAAALIAAIAIGACTIYIKAVDRAYYRERVAILEMQGTAANLKRIQLLKKMLELKKEELRILVEERIAFETLRICGKASDRKIRTERILEAL